MKNGLTREGGQGAAGDEDMVSEEWADRWLLLPSLTREGGRGRQGMRTW